MPIDLQSPGYTPLMRGDRIRLGDIALSPLGSATYNSFATAYIITDRDTAVGRRLVKDVIGDRENDGWYMFRPLNSTSIGYTPHRSHGAPLPLP